jgi:hypothetical protein
MARKVQLNRAVRIAGAHCDAGQVVEVDEDLAQQLIAANRAAEYAAPALALDQAPPAPAGDHPFTEGRRGRRNSR